ncbi:hypothetical protein PQC34_gp099 [Cronobacter phage A24]|uniref:Ig-like domain-containing protein n=1 Tax=Cronobacter phage A24 TaxID=2795745 RepID=A0A7T5QXT9_9CAUD|nr:hypothetical protein PQC34_gp099 [Cronobacter phage A24]QQG33635.1 hypothetical protein [Cronobacter phage A24]
MADVPSPLYKLNYPVETPEALAFWSSRFKQNRIKAIIAFSLNEDNANDNLRRFNYPRQFRRRALAAFSQYVNQPAMSGIPLSDGSKTWWEEMPYPGDFNSETTPPKPSKPTITSQPKSLTIKVGQAFSMSVTATGNGVITYQWQEKQPTGVWNNITHTEQSWTSSVINKTGVRTFRVIVTNTLDGAKESTTSDEAVVTTQAA